MASASPSLHMAAAFTAVLSLVASAAAQDRPRDTAPLKGQSEFTAAKGFGGLVAPNARLAGLFDAGGAPIRTKGVQSIQRIDTGVYCIRPIASLGMNVNTIVASVSVEYFYSNLDEVQVQWVATSSGCGAGRIGVYICESLPFGRQLRVSNRSASPSSCLIETTFFNSLPCSGGKLRVFQQRWIFDSCAVGGGNRQVGQ